MTSTFFPLIVLLSILGGLPSLSLNWLCQRLTFASTVPAPPGNAKTTSSAASGSPSTGSTFNCARRIVELGLLDFHEAGAWKVIPPASIVCGGASAPMASNVAAMAPRRKLRIRVLMKDSLPSLLR